LAHVKPKMEKNIPLPPDWHKADFETTLPHSAEKIVPHHNYMGSETWECKSVAK
jgi:hypothetical protein